MRRAAERARLVAGHGFGNSGRSKRKALPAASSKTRSPRMALARARAMGSPRPRPCAFVVPRGSQRASRTSGWKGVEVRKGSIGLCPCALHESVPSRCIAGSRAKLVEQQAERMQRVIELVEHGCREHPHGLIALDPLQSRAQRIGATRGFLGG